MATQTSQAKPAPEEQRKYELWRPIIRPQRRAALERIHHNVADDWSRTLADYLPRSKRIEFEGLSFESYSNLNTGDEEAAHTAVFALEGAEIGGALLISAELAHCLVFSRLGIPEEESSDGKRKAFTRIEMAILREAIRQLLASLGGTYAQAGVGGGLSRYSERSKDPLLFAPQDYVLVLRFRVDLPSRSLKLRVAVSRSMINAVGDLAVGKAANGSQRTGRAVARLPLEVDVVLGAWNVPLNELSALKPGDTVILPDGGDAWLATRGVKLMKVAASFTERRTTLEIKASHCRDARE